MPCLLPGSILLLGRLHDGYNSILVAGVRPPSSDSRRMGEGAWLEGFVEQKSQHSHRLLTSELHLCESNEFLSAVAPCSVVFF